MSRNNKEFNTKYPAIFQALAAIPDETAIDGEIVAFDHGAWQKMRVNGVKSS